MEKKCLNCGDNLTGRVDKKFCSDYCRNIFNNQQRAYTNNYMRRVNTILKKNRKILCELNPSGKTTVHRNQLQKLGYDFDYFTNLYTTKTGKTYFFCYEHGYLPIENNFLALVCRENKENKNKNE